MAQEGWICSRCGKVNAPWVIQCFCNRNTHIREIIAKHSNEGDLVLDNCMGSGTTAIACIREKRNFIGFELNKEYYDKACKRIQLEMAQPSIF